MSTGPHAGSNLSYAAGGIRSPFVYLGINRCSGWTPSVAGGWCSPQDGELSRTSPDTSSTWMAAGGAIPSADGERIYLYHGTSYPHMCRHTGTRARAPPHMRAHRHTRARDALPAIRQLDHGPLNLER